MLCAEVIAVDITWNGDRALAALRTARDAAVREVGAAAVTNAKAVCPVDTGRLRASIACRTDGGTAVIGTDVPYAACVELGTARQRAQPYLVPALSEHTQEYAALIRAALKGGTI